jgi:molybdopterin-binding protein
MEKRSVTQSARNRLRGQVEAVTIDGLMAQVELRVGDQRMVSLISAEAARELALAPGDTAVAVVKSTSVMVERDRD